MSSAPLPTDNTTKGSIPEPEAGIINFYQLKVLPSLCTIVILLIHYRILSWLMLTVPSFLQRPLWSPYRKAVSIEFYVVLTIPRLGQAAVFLIGGLTREERAVPLVLRSGDVLIMSGPRCRRAYHGGSLGPTSIELYLCTPF